MGKYLFKEYEEVSNNKLQFHEVIRNLNIP
jgi:hypothetical protein